MNLQPRQHLLFDQDWRFAKGDITNAENVNFEDDRLARHSIYRTTGASKALLSQDAPAGGGGGYLPGGLDGIESISAYQMKIARNYSLSSSMASIKIVMCGSMANTWAFTPTATPVFTMTSHHFSISTVRRTSSPCVLTIRSSPMRAGTTVRVSSAMFG